jgi:hypothetical protein
MPDFQERGAHDYRKDACLTLEEFERIVVRCIVHYNSERVISDYPYTDEMIQAHLRPYACDIWNWKLQESGTNLIAASEKEIALTLFPRTDGKFTRYGLVVNRLRYHRDGYKDEYLKGGNCTVAYNPDDVSHIWLKTDNGFEEFSIIETMYTGKTLTEVAEKKQNQDVLIKSEAEGALQAKIQLMAFIENAVEHSTPPPNTSIKGIREKRQSEKRKKHRNIEEVIENG